MPTICQSRHGKNEIAFLSQFVYKYKGKDEILVNEISVHFPSDMKQVPDVILSLFTKGTFGKKRLGYLRIKSSEKLLQKSSLDWFKFKNFGMGMNYNF